MALISVPHIGEDYGTVQVLYSDGEIAEFEVLRALAVVLQNIHGDRDLEKETA
ncbi:MAG TPA: hypothetical protein VH599_07325 [Ktedonobacterales bacterium]|jgi:hypothetical protein